MFRKGKCVNKHRLIKELMKFYLDNRSSIKVLLVQTHILTKCIRGSLINESHKKNKYSEKIIILTKFYLLMILVGATSPM